MSKYVIEGMYWTAGDDIFIDVKNDDVFTVVCLNNFIKKNIKENTNISITIDTGDNQSESIPVEIVKFIDDIINS